MINSNTTIRGRSALSKFFFFFFFSPTGMNIFRVFQMEEIDRQRRNAAGQSFFICRRTTPKSEKTDERERKGDVQG